jgi:hypothetical protein
MGPVCRKNIERNILWPTIKGNFTSEMKCFPNIKDDIKSNRKAFRHCNIINNEPSMNTNNLYSHWQNADISECVHDFLIKIKKDIFNFHTTDNFDENQIIRYVEQLYSYSVKFAKSSLQKTIHDISIIIDSLYYLIIAQVNLINLILFFFKFTQVKMSSGHFSF